MECSTAKPYWRSPFVIVLSTSTTVKVAEIIPWVHHSQVKTASLKWECIPDLASLYNACTLPWQDPASQETTRDHRQWDSKRWLVYAWRKLEESPISPLKMSLFHVFFMLILVSYLGSPRFWTVTHVCALPEWGVLLPKLWFSILIIPVAGTIAGPYTHNHTTTQCSLMMISISVLIPSIALRSNA
jgi:hypothetical protein